MRIVKGNLKMHAVNLSGVNGKKKHLQKNTSGRNCSIFAKWREVLAYFPTIHFFLFSDSGRLGDLVVLTVGKLHHS